MSDSIVSPADLSTEKPKARAKAKARASLFDWAALSKYLAPAIIVGLMGIVGVFLGITFNFMTDAVSQTRAELKEDIQQVKIELKEDMRQLRTELKDDNQQLKAELKEDMRQLKSELKDDITDLKDNIKQINLKIDRLLSRK